MKIIKFILILSISVSVYADSARKRVGFGGSHLAFLGSLNDYFRNGFAYNANGMWELPLLWEGFFLASSLQYAPIKGDDIRESSSLRMYSLNLGIDQELANARWYGLFLSLRPEITYWTLSNKLGRNYDASDKGNFWSVLFGLTHSFKVSSTLEIEFFTNAHIPQMSIANTYFDVGLRLAKNF